MLAAFTNFTDPLPLPVRGRSCKLVDGFFQERGENATTFCAYMTLEIEKTKVNGNLLENLNRIDDQ